MGEGMQTEPAQDMPLGQALPQRLQFAGSLETSVQIRSTPSLAAHSCRPAAQEQVPSLQLPSRQCRPQTPQFSIDICKFSHIRSLSLRLHTVGMLDGHVQLPATQEAGG